LLETPLEKIKYVAVEIIKKDSTAAIDIECGLFMGIIKKLSKKNIEDSFLTLILSEDSIKLYNVTEYAIVTIDIVDVDTRYFTVFTNEASDQKVALKLLKRVVNIMTNDNRLYSNDHNKELIDVDTYKDFPATVFKYNNLTQNTGDDETTKNDVVKKSSNSTTVSSVKKLEGPVVTNIRRKGKLPNEKKLMSMRDKVMRIANGTFKMKRLPVLPCDNNSEKDTFDKEEITKYYNMCM